MPAKRHNRLRRGASKKSMRATAPKRKDVRDRSDRFRMESKKYFLTYPQCPLTSEEYLLWISTKCATPFKYVIAQELHKDGTPHLHVYLELEKALSLTDAQFFDVPPTESPERPNYHPNIQSVRSPKAVQDYCIKEGNFKTNMDLTKTATKSPSAWMGALELARTGSVAEAIEALAATPDGAKQLCLHGPTLRANLRKLTPRKEFARHALSEYSFPSHLWQQDKTVLLLYGATAVGKTSLAKALLPLAMKTKQMDMLRDYQADTVTGFILDEFSAFHLHREAQLSLVDVDDDTEIHCRYTDAIIPRGTPRIFTTNKKPEEVLMIFKPEIARRVTCIEMISPTEFYLDPLYVYQPVKDKGKDKVLDVHPNDDYTWLSE